MGCVSADGPPFDPLFTHPDQYTAVYLYRPPHSRSSAVTPFIYINGKGVVSMKNGGFTRLYLKPGKYNLAVHKSHTHAVSDWGYEFEVPEKTKRLFIRVATVDNLAGELTLLALDMTFHALTKTMINLSGGRHTTEFGLDFIQENYALEEIKRCRYMDPEAYNLLAVLNVDVQGVNDMSITLPLTNGVREEIADSGKYEVLAGDTSGILLEEQSLRRTDAIISERAVTAGRILGVGKVVVCFVTSTNDSYVATLALINAVNGKVEAMKDIACNRNAVELIAAGKQAAKELIGKAKPVQSQPDNVTGPLATAGTTSDGVYKDPVTGMEFVLVKAGCYLMGEVTLKAADLEEPVHEVCVDSYYMGKYEVTQGQWKSIMKNNPAEAKKGDSYPVENVSWEDVRTFILNLRQKSGNYYRLPTEAEWEYAARSGGKNEKWAGTGKADELSEYAWYRNPLSPKSRIQPVGLKKPNGLGLHDMSGNVKEWVNDLYGDRYYMNSPKRNPAGPAEGDSRVLRGGSWDNKEEGVSVTGRECGGPSSTFNDYGFRLVLQ